MSERTDCFYFIHFSDLTSETAEKLVEKSKLINEVVTPEEIKTVVDLMEELGPSATPAEVQQLAKQSNVDLSLEDVETVVEIKEELGGKKLSDAEIQVDF